MRGKKLTVLVVLFQAIFILVLGTVSVKANNVALVVGVIEKISADSFIIESGEEYVEQGNIKIKLVHTTIIIKNHTVVSDKFKRVVPFKKLHIGCTVLVKGHYLPNRNVVANTIKILKEGVKPKAPKKSGG